MLSQKWGLRAVQARNSPLIGALTEVNKGIKGVPTPLSPTNPSNSKISPRNLFKIIKGVRDMVE